LIEIDEIGSKIAESIVEYFAEEHHKQLIAKLQNCGIQFVKEQSSTAKGSNKLEGLSIVISGSFEKYSREEIKDLIELHGGKNVSSISKKTNYLLAGDKIGPSKLEKAEKLGVSIISEDDFIEKIK
jgi:DNA ligase (NAD+)